MLFTFVLRHLIKFDLNNTFFKLYKTRTKSCHWQHSQASTSTILSKYIMTHYKYKKGYIDSRKTQFIILKQKLYQLAALWPGGYITQCLANNSIN